MSRDIANQAPVIPDEAIQRMADGWRNERSSRSCRARFRVLVLGCAFAATLLAGGARAACTPDPPASGETVTCSGTDSIGFEAPLGVDGLTVNVGFFAVLNESDPALDAAIGVNNDNTIRLNQTSQILVTEDGGFGVFAGDDNQIFVDGRIEVGADNGIGISTGVHNTPGTNQITIGVSGSVVGGLLPGMGAGDAQHGPLIEFRDFLPLGENRLLNSGFIGATRVTADPSTFNVAIMGTDGVEVIENLGGIRGNILLRGGDDRIEFGGRSQFAGLLDGGAGMNLIVLQEHSGSIPIFDLGNVINFSELRIGSNGSGGRGWILANGENFDGLTHVVSGGVLIVPNPIALGGPLTIDTGGIVVVSLESAAPSVSIADTTTFGGELRVVTGNLTLADSGTTIRLIEVTGGNVIGQFDSIIFIGESDARRFTDIYDANGLAVLFELDGFSSFASSPNQASIGAHLDAIRESGMAQGELQQFITNLELGSTAEIQSTLISLSPEAYDAQTSAIVESGRQLTRLLFDRPRDCQPGEENPWTGIATPLPCHARTWSPWLATFGSTRARDATGAHPRYDTQLAGVAIGVDVRPLDEFDLTFAFSSLGGSVNVANAGGSSLAMTELAAQGVWNKGPFRLQSAFSWGHGFHDDRRIVRYAGAVLPVQNKAKDEHESDRISLAVEAGLRFDVGPMQIEPLVSIDWAWVYQEEINESGAGPIGLRIESRDDSVGSVSSGIRASTTYHHSRYLRQGLEWMDGVWRPEIDVRWREVIKGTERAIEGRLAGAPAGVRNFRIEGEEDDQGVEVGAGVSFSPSMANRLQFDLRYQAFIASNTLEQDLTLRLQLSF